MSDQQAAMTNPSSSLPGTEPTNESAFTQQLLRLMKCHETKFYSRVSHGIYHKIFYKSNLPKFERVNGILNHKDLLVKAFIEDFSRFKREDRDTVVPEARRHIFNLLLQCGVFVKKFQGLQIADFIHKLTTI